jgi:uncharacterized protein with LGFP repeats
MRAITKRTAAFSTAIAVVALTGAGCSHATKAGQASSTATSSATSAVATGPSAATPTSTQIAGANGTKYTVEGPILAKYQSLDAATRKSLGAPTGNEQKHPDGGFQEFDGGAICVHGTGTYVILGKIDDKWDQLGGMDGKLGYPTGDEKSHPDGGGFQEFDGGAICAHGTGAAFVIWGKIRDKWDQLGGMDGKLGYPTSDETDTPDGAKKSTFEHGTITWKPGDAEPTVDYS